MPDSRIVPLSEPEERGRLESCTRGFSDRFGDRLLTVDRATATPLELLRFKTELSASGAFEEGLRERIEHTRVQDPAIAPARSVERWDGALVLVSRHVPGRRLSEVMAEERGPAFATEFIRQVVPAVAALAETNRRFAHGAITLERIVAGHDGRLTVVEHPLGPAVEALGWPTSRLQSELGLVMPDNRKSNLFDARVDVIQIGFVTLSLLLGRRIDAASYPANVTRLLDESAEAKGGETWAASRVRSWLERALQVGPRPIETIREAMNSLGELPGEGELPRKTAAPAATSAAAAAPPKVEPKPVVPAKPATRLAQVVPAKKVETPHTAAAPSTPPAPPAPAVPVLVARPPAPAPAPAAAPEAPVAPLSVKPPRRFSAASMALAAVSVLALAEGVVLAGRWYLEPKPAAVVEPARPTESASAAVAPEPPKPAPERKAANPPPAAPVDIAPRHEAPPAAPEPAAPAAAVAARRFGGMTIVSPLELQVFEGGTRIGAAGAPIAVLEGVHNIDLVNDALGFRVRETITVKPGELTSRSIAVPNGRVSVNAMPWAEVLIDGNPAGQTPLANLSLSIGEHQFTFRHPQLGEQRQTAVVKSEGVTRLSANMQK